MNVTATNQATSPGAASPMLRQWPSSKRKLWPDMPGWTGKTLDLSAHSDLHKAAAAIARLSRQESGSVVLAGNTGCGKTTFAEILLYSIGGEYRTLDFTPGGVESIWSAVFYDEPRLLDEIKATFKTDDGPEGIVKKCNKARVLIIDDMGAGYVKAESAEWYTSLMWRILDNRHDKITLITTNLMPAELRERVGYRSYSRLQEMLSAFSEAGSENFIMLFDVPDYRKRRW